MMKAHPVEMRTGIGLASGRDMLMTGDVGNRVAFGDGGREYGETCVLGITKIVDIAAFEFDTDREIIAAFAAFEI